MRESELQAYLRGRTKAERLRQCLRNAIEYGEGTMTSRWERDLPADSEVIVVEDILYLIKEFLAGRITAEDLQEIAFILIGSDGFTWDGGTQEGEIVANTLHDWASPEINGPITEDSIKKRQRSLRTSKSRVCRETRRR